MSNRICNNPILIPLVEILLMISASSIARAQGLFKALQTYDSGGGRAWSLAAGDVNGDGKPDLIVANRSFVISRFVGLSVLLGNGDGSFQPALNYGLNGLEPASVAIADVNSDGKPDLLTTTDWSSDIQVLLGTGDGTFQTPVVQHTNCSAFHPQMLASDVNRDGKIDLLVAPCGWWNIGVLLGNGDATFQLPKTYASGGVGINWIAMGDVNMDGKVDVLISEANESQQHGVVGILRGNGDGSFQTPLTIDFPDGMFVGSLALADTNGDGVPDLIARSNTYWVNRLNVLLGHGNGSFTLGNAYTINWEAGDPIAVADFNRDKKIDVVIPNWICHFACDHSSVGVYIGNGNGTFQGVRNFRLGGDFASWVTVADVNRDFKTDIIAANYFWDGHGVVSVYLGATKWRTSTTITSNLNPSIYGQAVTLMANVTSAGWIAPTGKVTNRLFVTSVIRSA